MLMHEEINIGFSCIHDQQAVGDRYPICAGPGSSSRVGSLSLWVVVRVVFSLSLVCLCGFKELSELCPL